MKTIQLLVLLVFVLSATLKAQPNPEKKQDTKARFTDEQITKMKAIKLETYKATMPLMNKIGELRAKHETLTKAEKPDLNAINANIDDIAKHRVQIEKIKIANMLQFRAMLTDEQRMFIDTHKQKSGNEKMHKKNSKKHDLKERKKPQERPHAELGVNEL